MADKEVTFYHPETGEILNGIAKSLLSGDGRFEYPDPVPLAPPVNLRVPSGMRQLVQEMIRQEMSQLAELHEMETFEEADDFEIEDDPLDPLTPYEKVFDPKDADKAPRVGGEGASAAPGAAPSAAPSHSPTNGSGATITEPVVKRSESHEPSTGNVPTQSAGQSGAGNR